MLLTFIIFIVVVSLLVFVHELGHFMTARRLGVTVEEFGFGFPPRIFGLRRRGTVYSLNWIPFGGFVRLKGETPGTSLDPDSFAAQSRPRRFGILAAGVLMNYLLSAVLFTAGFTVGLPSVSDTAPGSAPLKDVRPQIVSLEDGGPAAHGGLRVGDSIVAFNDRPLTSSRELKELQRENAGSPITLSVQRGQRQRTLTLSPAQSPNGDYRIGVGILDVGTLTYPFPQSIWYGLTTTVRITGDIFVSFGHLLRDLVVERTVSPDLSGPVGVVVLTGQALELGWPYLIQFTALLSVTLAVINFFPLPALDGGRALFVIIESVRRKAIDYRVESLIHAIGFYVLIALVLLVSLRDVQRLGLGDKLVENVRQIFGG
ncbi:MAG: site-2 protease family protein [Candidatus Kerfeldbacteria bacterium]|nr:site-2 protease family protein [Candidatus Kerfeldbacteria bacterium]